MKKNALFCLVISGLMSVSAFADGGPHSKKFRLDCNFHKDLDHRELSCRSNAEYVSQDRDHNVGVGLPPHRVELKDIRYSVICNGKVVFSNEGMGFSTDDPNSVGEDHIRPTTSNTPKTRVLYAGALIKDGSYEALLDLNDGSLAGSCDVTTVEQR